MSLRWKVLSCLLLTAASPVFIVNSISLYSMPAHLLCNIWFARLLLQHPPRQLAALGGLVGAGDLGDQRIVTALAHRPRHRHALLDSAPEPARLRGVDFGPCIETLPALLLSRPDERLGRAINRVELAMCEA